ncbi:MAG: hypothetical protein O7D94_08315, partial [Planctomycetota bacterium]|nr:hypothetical protein [Planctomycetota bacterium]
MRYTTNLRMKAFLRLYGPLVLMLLCAPGVGRAAVIGVLEDGRQAGEGGFLSLMGDSSATARQALQADGHTLVALDTVPPASASVDVLWLPLLASSSSYEIAEAIALKQYVVDGGSIVFIGGPDVYNVPDDSFLSEFGLAKIEGNLSAEVTPSLLDHPIVTGPHGAVGTIGSTGGYGLFASVADVADVFVGINTDDPPVSGTVAGLLSPGAADSGAGRVAFVCDPFMFGPSLDQADRDHRVFLRNLVKWAAAGSGYTQSGTLVETGAMTVACGGCDTIASLVMVFSSVSETGETTVSSLGVGRCGFDGAVPEPLPLGLRDFTGYALELETTAVYTGPIDVVVAYDPASLSELGILDPLSLEVWWVHPVSTDLIPVSATVDEVSNTVSIQVSELGTYLVGADVESFADCDGNGTPDECQSAVTLTFVVEPAEGGSVAPAGSLSYPVCQTVPISASPNAGYCFGGWTVDTGMGPVDSSVEETTIEVDVTKTVTAGFVPVITGHPGDQFVCAGAGASFSVAVHASQGGATFAWQRGGVPLAEGERFSGILAETLVIDAVEPDDAGFYRCAVTYTCNGGEEASPVTSESALLTVGEAPVIAVQPVPGIVCADGAITLSVEAEGTAPLTYRWWKDGTEIDGAGGSSYAITNAEASDSGAYHVVVSNVCEAEAVSQTVTVDVQDRPTIDVQPAGGTRCAGSSFEFSIETTGGEPLSYQWRRDGATLEGATEHVLTIDPVTTADAGAYVLIVQNANGCGAVTSEPAELIVVVAPSIVEGPVEQDVCEAGLLSLGVVAAGSEPLYYQWHKDGVPIEGETDATLEVSAVLPDDAGAYSVVVTNDTDCGTATSDPATVSVLAPTAVTSDPADRAVCMGGSVTFAVEATGAGLLYQWSFRASGGQQFIDLADGEGVSGANAAALDLSSAGVGFAGGYRCTVFSDCGDPYVSPIAHLDVTSGACDCNDNGTPDADDLAGGTSNDCDGDGVPDECQLTDGDCNADGVPDRCQLSDNDCDGDGVPDDCQLAGADCNGDGILDGCQLSANDCNANGVPDDCEPAFSVDIGADISGCVGQFVQLNAVVDAGASNPPYEYAWRIISGPEDGATIVEDALVESSFEATLPGTYEVESAVSDSSDPPCVALDVLTIAVDELALTVGAGFRMCASGTSGPLAVDVLNGSGPYSYQWTVEPGGSSTSQTQFTDGGAEIAHPTFTPDVPGAYVVRVTV